MKIGIECFIGRHIGAPLNAAPLVRNIVTRLPAREGVGYVLFVDAGTESFLGLGGRSDVEYARVGRIRNKGSAILLEQFILPRLIVRFGVDVYCSLISNELPLAANVPMVLKFTNIAVFHYPARHTLPVRVYRACMNRMIMKKARLIIANSASMKEDILRFFPRPATQVPVLYEPVDPYYLEAVDPGEASAAVALKFGVRGPYLLYVSSLTPCKDPETLLRAFAAVKQRESLPHMLVFVGAGELAGRLQRMAESLGVAKSVIMTGFLKDKQDVRYLYKAASAVVLPSLYEATGNVALQALAVGTPLIASRIFSLPEMVADAAVLFPPQDPDALAAALSNLLGDPILQRSLVLKGKRQIERFSDWNANVCALVDLIVSAATGLSGSHE